MSKAQVIQGGDVAPVLEQAMEASGGLLRLTPTWVPRSFLHPGRRLKLHPDDLYAYGAERGGIDERWFASTTEAANEGRVWHEGLSFVSFGGKHFTLKDAVQTAGPRLIGETMWETEWNTKGSISYADGKLYCYEERSGNLALVEPTPESFKIISSFRISKGTGPHWTQPVIHDGILYIRHGEALMAFDIKA